MAEFFVYENANDYAGKCYYTNRHGRVSSVFSYSPEYIGRRDAYNIDPAFQMTEGSQVTSSTIPRAFSDSAPDRWGRNLIYKRHIYEAKQNGVPARELNDVDYLLGVSDATRQGSLRYKMDKMGSYVHESEDIPKLITLPKLLNSTKALANKDSNEAIKYLLDAGTASLGGARPKATVTDGGRLYIAKFPHIHDEWDVIAWEYVALSIAREAGIATPDFELIDVEGANVLLVERFDRNTDPASSGTSRTGYMSAMTLLRSDDGQRGDYADLCLQMADVSMDYRKDLRELYRRIILSVLINNTDDHLRNHGFLRAGTGWKLSPVFDINPNPSRDTARATSIYGVAHGEAQLGVLRENCGDFLLDNADAEAILKEVKGAVKTWRNVAVKAGIRTREIEMMRGIY
jgi:serine/threonine-protein kinase HipA